MNFGEYLDDIRERLEGLGKPILYSYAAGFGSCFVVGWLF